VARSKRPTIGLVVPHLTEAGGVATMARFIKETILAANRHDLRVISLATAMRDPCNVSFTRPSTWSRGPTTRTGEWEGVPCVHAGAVGGELGVQRFRPRRLRAGTLAGCDLVQVVSGVPAWANTVRTAGRPVAVQSATMLHVERRRLDSEPNPVRAVWQRAMTRVISPLDRRVLTSVDAIQVYNPWMLKIARDLNANRPCDIRYAPPGIDAETFHPLAAGRTPGERPYILSVGRLHDPRKNLELLLAAMARLPADLRLVVAGATPPTSTFWRTADRLGVAGRVEYVAKPSLAALVSLYQHARVFALPSHEEGLGLVLLEAMACGVPVVSTRSGGPDGIVTDGDDGFLTPLDDAATLAARLARLHADSTLNIEMGRRARATVERVYSQRAAMQPYLECWERLLA